MIQNFKFSGHRGYKDKSIENTKESFLKAIEENLDYIELDIRKTKDNIPIVFHDKKLNRMLSKKRAKIENYSLKELKRFEYKDGQKILTLEEVLSILKGKIRIIIDIKIEGIESKVIELIKKYTLVNDVIIQSKKGEIINNCYRIAPHLPYSLYRGYLGKMWAFGDILKIHKFLASVWYYIKVRPYHIEYINLDGPYIYDDLIELCHQNGLKIILGSWKVKKYIKYARKWDIDIINSNNPEKIKKYLKYYHKKGLLP
jgi:glycerophosphoryl diester phosphodiesterase